MKRLLCLCISSLSLSITHSFGQDITLSADSVTLLLCKKWEVNYALMDGMKVGRAPGAVEVNYEFKKDKTFLFTSNDPKDGGKGVWSYDPKKKMIKLTMDVSGIQAYIISLKEGEFVEKVIPNNSAPKDLGEVRFVYKIRKS